jgi:hypothetical protein
MNIGMSYGSSLCSLIPKICTLGTVYILPLWRSLKITCLPMTCSPFLCFIRMFCPDGSLFYTSDNNFWNILGNSDPLFLHRIQRRWYTQEWGTKSYWLNFCQQNCVKWTHNISPTNLYWGIPQHHPFGCVSYIIRLGIWGGISCWEWILSCIAQNTICGKYDRMIEYWCFRSWFRPCRQDIRLISFCFVLVIPS